MGTTLTTPAQPKPKKIDVEAAQEVIFKPNPGPQTNFLSAPEQEVLFGGAAGGGKLVQFGDPILTPDGFINIENLSEGSVICGTGGSLQVITQLKAWEKLPKWVVRFSDGTHLDVAGEHLWEFWVSGQGEKSKRVASTKDMKSAMEKHKRNLQIRVPGICTFNEQEVLIDPYFLGILLGDGGFTTPSVVLTSDEKDQPEYLEKLKLPTSDVNITGKVIRFIGKTRKNLVKNLRHYGLQGLKSVDKFIPQEYLINSELVRLEILRGLMDTDGYSSPEKNAVYFYTVSEQLSKDVAFLVRSLGGTVSISSKIGRYRGRDGIVVECQRVYSLYIRHPEPDSLFNLKRKKHGKFGKNLCQKTVVSIENNGEVFGRCISVSNSDGLYITKDFIVTHNSFAVVADPVRGFDNPNFRGLLLRRTTEELRELIAVSKQLYPKAIPGIKFLEREKTWVAPSGATLWMSYLDSDDDVSRYQGQAFSWIGFDELTHWGSPFAWNYLRSRLRTSSDSGLKLYQRATTNPGGPGHQWVKKMFIDPAPPNTSFWATDIDSGEIITWPKGHSKEGQPLFKRKFIPSKLFDNPYLADDGMYEANLLSLPEHQRKQLLEGNWDVNSGAAFPEFDRKIHVVEPFEVPYNWVRFRAADYGYGSNTGVLWFAVSPSEQIVVYRELYCSKVTAWDLADLILEAELGEKIRYGVLDSSLWHNRGDRGPSLAEQMISKGCRWRPSDRSRGSRVAGKNEIHRRLQVDPFTEEPRLIIFDSCRNLISQLPSIPLDKNNPEDVDTNAEDHLYDALRYGIMSRPKSSMWDYDSTLNSKRFKMADATFGY